MADVEMTDAAQPAKSSKVVAESSDKKPRFEVKKVRHNIVNTELATEG